MEEKKKITLAAGVVAGATLLSRITGYLRDIITAAFFGAGMAADAFFVAFRIPNLLRRFFAEGSMVIAFVPVFTDYLKNKSKEEAFALAHITLTILSLLLAVFTLLGVVFSPLVVKMIAPGFAADPEKFRLTVLLNQIMFPYLFLVSIGALAMGILNSLGHFATPALAPVLLNVSMIACVFALAPVTQPVVGLSIGVIVGGVLQLVIQYPYLRRFGYRPRLILLFNHPGVKRILKLWLVATFGVAIYLINVFVGTILASFLPVGSVTYLWYATRLMEFPLGIFVIPLAVASLPSLSRQAAEKNFTELKATINFAVRMVLFISTPAMVGTIALRVPIIATLFGWGKFDYMAAVKTADALLYYSVGLWGVAGARIISQAYFSMQDARTPVYLAAVSLAVNIIFSLLLMGPMKHSGLAFANSLASIVNFLMLVYSLRRRVGPIGLRKILISVVKVALASVPMGLVASFIAAGGPWATPGMLTAKVIYLAAAVTSAIAVFVVAAYLLRAEEIVFIVNLVRQRFSRRLARFNKSN